MLDRDIILGRYMIDRLYKKLSKQHNQVAYSYASFKFTGHINKEFPAEIWDINKLLLQNYISSNSLFKSNVLLEVGLVTDEKYKRLLDWAFLLKLFLVGGYYGVACPEASFEAVSNKDSVSSGTVEDYYLKRERVITDFGKPIVYKFAQKQETIEQSATSNAFQLDF